MEYKIAHFPRENERAIMRIAEDGTWWLSPENVWTQNKERAKRFYHESEVRSALSIVKFKGNLEEEKPYRPEGVAESWGELSSR